MSCGIASAILHQHGQRRRVVAAPELQPGKSTEARRDRRPSASAWAQACTASSRRPSSSRTSARSACSAAGRCGVVCALFEQQARRARRAGCSAGRAGHCVPWPMRDRPSEPCARVSVERTSFPETRASSLASISRFAASDPELESARLPAPGELAEIARLEGERAPVSSTRAHQARAPSRRPARQVDAPARVGLADHGGSAGQQLGPDCARELRRGLLEHARQLGTGTIDGRSA